MKTHLLLIDNTQRRRQVVVEASSAFLDGFVITSWHGCDLKNQTFALTHSKTGRLAHLNPKSLDELQEYIRELRRCRIEPMKIFDAETAEHYFVQRLSQEALEMAQA